MHQLIILLNNLIEYRAKKIFTPRCMDYAIVLSIGQHFTLKSVLCDWKINMF